MLRQKRFKLDEVDDNAPSKMKTDLEARIGRGETWEVAIIQGSETGRGMVLLREGVKPGTFEGVFYRAGDCGADQENVKATAEMLCMLGIAPSPEALYDGFLKHYSKVGITGIGTDKPEYAPIH